MKVMTILGTRPEIIRLSLIIRKLDDYATEHILVHTGQNFTASLSEVFFQELNVRQPDYILANQQLTLGEQLSKMYKELEGIFLKEKPDKILVLGDTNSGLSAILAERMGIPVIHMEAGNRCFDLEVPEEKNRRIIDSISSFNLPYTPQSKENLLREGIPSNRIIVSGNPINEVLTYYKSRIEDSKILNKLSLKEGDYFLVTAHRAENVDHEDRLLEIIKGINMVAEYYQKRVICSIHPRTKSRIEHSSLVNIHPLVELHKPFGFFDFVKLEKNAYCVLTDSGTVQEECCLFHVPTVTIRKTTERPETIECGSNMLSGISADQILSCVHVMVNQLKNWYYPEGYGHLNVSDKVIKVVLGGIKGV
ncbi:UDP-N-acetylglucosamine 2-epimerase (non-hydrolyzing) [Priestia megaterium]|jgi:UDP-N-acetylglucosamine 2-epimerase (non-hydrolysing)|uniref:UDP-N-acetylglucosamine 2-epimerase (Non-hydrolyzing) n=5 Tax=Priestia TaxID=2800373 RepID=A0AAE5P488_PRIMG|nr:MULTISPECIES: UDP-N-acetylglucosamine 2-epimerase (non-hydrolyzing) [Priestia]MCJ7983330.1 UDP-N-acetylglucosamine 2-epimerase (non-hydrolyzing) [Priestia sp. OVL9]MDH6651289.1 UDP-N-acetylglucosamine 2-epimerase (non-hydrolyzing) [Bacillus sp. PvP124]MBA9042260.1 UDP-N-acetylglucosamine 2-epimerase (non-hydrolyzing) [Priestia aryabhattai]MBQ4869299.1 UDP-N-acetylglucosamine 2-epimerase (non-hydrolyzing) [Priestia megaterium]MBV6738232.1 UDP-N-acetylglucosamine 2-epimerase (non-hydrolyzing)